MRGISSHDVLPVDLSHPDEPLWSKQLRTDAGIPPIPFRKIPRVRPKRKLSESAAAAILRMCSTRGGGAHAWWLDPPQTLEEQIELFNRRKHCLDDDDEEGSALRELFKSLEQHAHDINADAKEANPLAFATLYWEQVLKCNCWVWGISFLCDFDANRKGKTAGAIINALLWMFPNDPAWHMFIPYTDEWGRHVELFRRPNLRSIKLIQQYLRSHPEDLGDPKKQPYDPENIDKFNRIKNALPNCFLPCYPEPSATESKLTAWQGAPDADYHKNIIMPEWRKWIPKYAISSDSEYEKRFILDVPYESRTIKGSQRQVEWTILFKSYESKDEKFSGAAVRAIILTEGIKQTHLNEIKQRFQTDAFASWDYTPYESRNTGVKSNLAHKVFTGKEVLPLHPFVFSGFGIGKVPTYVLSEEKKMDLERMWRGRPEGKARLEGEFFSSSPVVLSNLDLHFHGLPWTKQELFDRYPGGQIYRSLDPGYDHPTVGAWGYLTRLNTWFIYRVFAETGLSIGQRCEKMIKLSGNERHIYKYGQGQDDYYYEEVHPNEDSEVSVTTVCDFHMFATDQRTLRPYSTNYIKEGLICTPSVTTKPRDRVQEFNNKLQPSTIVPHPERKVPPGAKVFFLLNEPGVAEACEKLENIFWQRYTTGDRKGDPKDEIQEHDDDELDAISYLVCSPYVWTAQRPPRKSPKENFSNRANPMTSYVKPQIGKRRKPIFQSTGY
jgi:hypothetical protein